MKVVFESEVPRSNGTIRMSERSIGLDWKPEGCFELMQLCVTHYLKKDVLSAVEDGEELEINLNESERYYDCDKDLLLSVINNLVSIGEINISKVQARGNSRKKNQIILSLVA